MNTSMMTSGQTTRTPSSVDGLRPVSSALRYFLLIHTEEQVLLREVREGEPLVLGRGDESAVPLRDTLASRLHARFSVQQKKLRVEDLGSRNGTQLKNEFLRSKGAYLSPGDEVVIGGTKVAVFFEKEGRAALAEADAELRAKKHLDLVIGDARMAEVYETVSRLARVRTHVLILGETGVGKDMVAQRLHALGPRADAPFVRLNCAALPDTLLESELFGYEKGAFSGADRQKVGYFEAADRGTLFLDEIGELSPVMQAKLLSVLEDRTIRRLGGTTEIPVDVRIVSATHRDLPAAVAQGQFREDLYYRISTFRVSVPPLRERRADVLPLAQLFIRRFAAEVELPVPELTPEATQVLLAYEWPGNVRQLRNAMEHAVVSSRDGKMGPEALPEELSGSPELKPGSCLRSEVEAFERRLIERVLAQEGGNQTRAAARLGLPRRTFVFKLAAIRRSQGRG